MKLSKKLVKLKKKNNYFIMLTTLGVKNPGRAQQEQFRPTPRAACILSWSDSTSGSCLVWLNPVGHRRACTRTNLYPLPGKPPGFCLPWHNLIAAVGHGRYIYTMEIGKSYKSRFPDLSVRTRHKEKNETVDSEASRKEACSFLLSCFCFQLRF